MIPSWLNDYIGIPYRENGRDRDGCDCWGLLALIYAEQLGTPLPEYTGKRWEHGDKADQVGPGAAAYASMFELIPAGSERLGDGVLIRMRGHPLHVGMVVEPGWMIHAHEGADACLEQYRRPEWEKRVLGFYRYLA